MGVSLYRNKGLGTMSRVSKMSRLSTWEEAMIHIMYLYELKAGSSLVFSGRFILAMMGSPMTTYHIERLRRLSEFGWIEMEKVDGLWKFWLTDTARTTLAEHCRYAWEGVQFSPEHSF